ncbi:hypothetical protein AVEN_91024-1 [Araneus ventricosus]|uniref:Uncharacterized protein n=1 Tax=Araneus ventricosus TaxID=182803 RepID=A0A4Y2MAA5_ARAVE|nr:hypothetical protein AVEN_91024-1 [Araneus ventricosus]
MVRVAYLFTKLYQEHQTKICTDPENASISPRALPQLLKEIQSPSTDYFVCGEIGNPLHYATKCLLPSSYHTSKQAHNSSSTGGRAPYSVNSQDKKIYHLIEFLASNEDLIKSQNYNTNTDSNLEIYTSTNLPLGTRNSKIHRRAAEHPNLRPASSPH